MFSYNPDEYLSRLWSKGYDKLAIRFSQYLSTKEESTILELGCGTGELTIPISRFVKGKMIALDQSQDALRFLEQKLSLKGLNSRVRPVRAKASKFLKRSQSFDSIFSNFFMGWLDFEQLDEVFERIYNSLNLGGGMIHSDFHTLATTNLQNIAIEQGKPENNIDPSLKWWTPKEVIDLAESKGFQEISSETFDWKTTLPPKMAFEQLKNWEAKPEFILKNEEVINKLGISLPNSFIISAKKI